MPDSLYFTDSDEANQLIASDPMALLVGFVLDQHWSVLSGYQEETPTQRRAAERTDG